METRHYSICRAVIPQRAINKRITHNHIVNIVSEYLEIPFEQMCRRSRKREIVNARHYCYYFMDKYTKMTQTSIGRVFGHYDHTTVIHGLRVVNDQMDVNRKVENDIDTINKRIIMKYIL